MELVDSDCYAMLKSRDTLHLLDVLIDPATEKCFVRQGNQILPVEKLRNFAGYKYKVATPKAKLERHP